MKRTHLLFALSILLSCSGCEEKSTSASVETCKRQASELKDWLATVHKEGGGERYPVDPARGAPRLVALDDPAEDLERWELFANLREDILSLGGGVGGYRDSIQLAEFAPALKAKLDAEEPRGDGPGLFLLAIDAQSSWSSTAKVLASATSAGITRVTLVFDAPAPTRSVSAPKISSRMTSWVTRMRESIEKPSDLSLTAPRGFYDDLKSTCRGVEAVFDKVGDADLSKKHETFVEDLPVAFQECGCKPDLEDVKVHFWYGMFSRLGEPEHTSGINVTLSSAAGLDVVDIEASADSLWQEVHTKFVGLEGKTVFVKVIASD